MKWNLSMHDSDFPGPSSLDVRGEGESVWERTWSDAHHMSCQDGMYTAGQPLKVWSGYSTQCLSVACFAYENKGACSIAITWLWEWYFEQKNGSKPWWEDTFKTRWYKTWKTRLALAKTKSEGRLGCLAFLILHLYRWCCRLAKRQRNCSKWKQTGIDHIGLARIFSPT